MFSRAAAADHFISEVSQSLDENGIFIATTIDSRILALYVMKALYGPANNTDIPVKAIRNNENLAVIIEDELGHQLLQIKMAMKDAHRLLAMNQEQRKKDGDDDSLYCTGIQYTFILNDSSDEAAVNAPEWVVPLGLPLNRLLAKHNLTVYKIQNFHDFVEDRMRYPESLQRMIDMNVLNRERSISTAEWAIARLYTVLILKKQSNGAAIRSSWTLSASITETFGHEPKTPAATPPASPKYLIYADSPTCSPPRYRPRTPDEPPSFLVGNVTLPQNRWIALPPLDYTRIAGQDVSESHDMAGTMNVEVEEEEDEEVLRATAELEYAIALAGGQEKWDVLTEEESDELLSRAKSHFQQNYG